MPTNSQQWNQKKKALQKVGLTHFCHEARSPVSMSIKMSKEILHQALKWLTTSAALGEKKSNHFVQHLVQKEADVPNFTIPANYFCRKSGLQCHGQYFSLKNQEINTVGITTTAITAVWNFVLNLFKRSEVFKYRRVNSCCHVCGQECSK